MDETIPAQSRANPSRSEVVEKRVAPLWVFKLANPVVKALLQSRLHGMMSGTLMLITYRGRKSGKWYTNPIGYFQWDTEEVIAFTSGGWWVNVADGTPVTLLIQGQWLEAVPTVIREQTAVIETVEEFIRRLGLKPGLRMALGLPKDREPTPDDLRAIPPGRTVVLFKIVRRV